MHNSADISEIFVSYQGEGLLIGEKQLFIRFNKCNLNCSYCDTPSKKKAKKYTPEQLLKKTISILKKEKIKIISLTGGEPLIYADFLKIFLKLLKKKIKIKIYLETNSTLPLELKEIINHIDIISADFKLSSSGQIQNQFEKHKKFFNILKKNKKNFFIKAIVNNKTTKSEFNKMVQFLSEYYKNIPIIIQPEMQGTTIMISRKKLKTLLKIADNKLKNIKLIPQAHKILKIK